MADDTAPPTVLIVEDERALADIYADFLASYTVLTADGGEEALDAIGSDVDVVLLDRRMAGLSGEEVLEAIREAGYDCRVAMVTAVTPDVDILEMDFDEYLIKPVEKTELVGVVERLLELNSYDELVGEYYRLVSKKGTLEAEHDEVTLREHDQFRRLTERVAEIEEALDAREETLSVVDIGSLMR